MVFSIGGNIKHLIDRPDEPYCFRLQKDRVYYVRLAQYTATATERVCAFDTNVKNKTVKVCFV